MRLAVTADLHLTTREEQPERYQTLGLILEQCGHLDVEVLFIAGDLFDRHQQNLADLEATIRQNRPPELELVILPGNHDPHLRPGTIAIEGVRVVSAPKLLQIDDELQLLLIPYRSGSTMGEELAQFRDRLEAGKWILVSHADWLGGQRQRSPEEPGIYLPITQKDLSVFQPLYCLLGHIHRPSEDALIFYAGSPYPLDITETGVRRFLVFDSKEQAVSSEPVNSSRVFFNEKIVMLPVKDEVEYLKEKLESMQSGWNLPADWREKVQLRLRLIGYASDRARLNEIVHSSLSDLDFYPGSPDLSNLAVVHDPDREEIARRVEDVIEQMAVGKDIEVDQQQVLEHALAVIYGG